MTALFGAGGGILFVLLDAPTGASIVIGAVCVSVCLCVCVSVRTKICHHFYSAKPDSMNLKMHMMV